MAKVYRKGPAEVTPDMEAQIAALAAMPDDQIDTSDIPEVTDFSGFQRGRFYKPVKQSLTLRVDADLIDWFKRHSGPGGKGYQSKMNAALRRYVMEHSE
jgi:uncharacterized protein (DUF4415 family)